MTQRLDDLPKTQHAIQLVASGKLQLNPAKEVFRPGPHQMLARVEACGICFSDVKLLKQFASHARKSAPVAGVTKEALLAIPSFVPGDKPTVPGHEVVCRIVAVGEGVRHHSVGERCLVQADFRHLPTAGSNAAFGYNFEGALQEYVLLDERIVIAPDGERYLIPVDESLGASQAALVEPWACVEDSYVSRERRTLKAGGRLLVVADPGAAVAGLAEALDPAGPPASLTAVCADDAQRAALALPGVRREDAELASLPNEAFDDIVYFGARKDALESLNDKLAARGVLALVTAGRRIGAPVSVGVGRVHYSFTRWVGTRGNSAAEAYRNIPPEGELRDGDRVLVVGAAGPMGQMHIIRNICSGRRDLSVTGTDMDAPRLATLERKARPLAQAHGVTLRLVNTKTEPLSGTFTYFALMAPVGELVARAIEQADTGALINIFAGIPAPTRQALDLDAYIDRKLYMFGTSGSTVRDMTIVRDKVSRGQLNTDSSVDAVCGMAGAAEAIAAVENRQIVGKIIVYPRLHGVGLVRLSEMPARYPTVAAKLDNGWWCKAAEAEWLQVAGT